VWGTGLSTVIAVTSLYEYLTKGPNVKLTRPWKIKANHKFPGGRRININVTNEGFESTTICRDHCSARARIGILSPRICSTKAGRQHVTSLGR
jgi:hypothetical protein